MHNEKTFHKDLDYYEEGCVLEINIQYLTIKCDKIFQEGSRFFLGQVNLRVSQEDSDVTVQDSGVSVKDLDVTVQDSGVSVNDSDGAVHDSDGAIQDLGGAI